MQSEFNALKAEVKRLLDTPQGLLHPEFDKALERLIAFAVGVMDYRC